ncbi:tryptophan synthase beta subunit-like PLP-dependent enzyme [Xylariaceae sp. FL1272]|nr:tryptophan synthase beta subunit-like PLP-dependent enzyme [Xylariaceae sp. FL1272]
MTSHWRRPVRFNPAARSWSSPETGAPDLVRAFHQQLPNAQPTQLTSLDELAKQLGVHAVFVKNESSRNSLPSFKILGASWGAYRAITQELGLPLDSSVATVKQALTSRPITLYTATDGNHGRAVARVGAVLGTPVEVHVPASVNKSEVEKIQSEGATVVVSSADYDATVMIAHRAAQVGGGLLIQDFAFDGYEEIAQWIVDGYQTLMLEIDDQLQGLNPDLVVTPAGVGSLAQAVVSHFKRAGAQTTVLAVEPDTAACFYHSVKQDKIVPIQTSPTIMTGLDCGTVSTIAWPLLKSGVDANLTISDFESHTAARDLQALGVNAGPCGAASLAALRRLTVADRAQLGLTDQSVVLFLCTEGKRDYDIPRSVFPSDVVSLTQALVQINSSNPLLGTVPGPGETEIARYIMAWLEHRDIETHWVEPHPGRPSIVGVVRGSGGDGAKSLMFNGHIDTVTCLSYDGDALSGEVADGKVYGRGAADMKGGVAAALIALATARTLDLRGDVIFTGVADEEATSIGTEDVLAAGWTADAAIVNEPTDLNIIHVHKGFVWFEVDVLGIAAHGSRYDLGVDAISKAGYFLVALDKYAQRIQQYDGTGLPPSVHASIIKGGEEASSYPTSCTVTIERRTVKGETRDGVRQEIQKLLDEVVKDVRGFRYELRTIFDRSPYELPLDHPFLTLVKEKVKKGTGKPPIVAREHYWTDCSLISDAGIPVLLLGPHGEGLHAKEEFAKVESLEQTTNILNDIVKEFCK